MARRVRPLLAHVGSLLDPKPPVRSLFERADAKPVSAVTVPREEGDHDGVVVGP